MELLELPKFAIPIFFIGDIVLTYAFFKRYRMRYPKDTRWQRMEINPLIKFYWSKYGLELGTIFAFVTVMPIILFMIFITSKDKFLFGMVVGIYWMVFMLHWKMKSEFRKEVRHENLRDKMHKIGKINEGSEV